MAVGSNQLQLDRFVASVRLCRLCQLCRLEMKAEANSEKRASAAAEVNENEPAQKLARKLVRNGGIEFRNRSLEMPAGPKNLEDRDDRGCFNSDFRGQV